MIPLPLRTTLVLLAMEAGYAEPVQLGSLPDCVEPWKGTGAQRETEGSVIASREVN